MGKRKLILSLILVVGLSFAAVAQAQQPTVNTITAEELKTMMANNQPVTVIDVRSSESFANSTTTLKGSLHFKVRKLRDRLNFPPLKDLPRNREIVTYCACPNDESSTSAAQILLAAGFTRVRVLKGGWNEWQRVKGPVQQRTRS